MSTEYMYMYSVNICFIKRLASSVGLWESRQEKLVTLTLSLSPHSRAHCCVTTTSCLHLSSEVSNSFLRLTALLSDWVLLANCWKASRSTESFIGTLFCDTTLATSGEKKSEIDSSCVSISSHVGSLWLCQKNLSWVTKVKNRTEKGSICVCFCASEWVCVFEAIYTGEYSLCMHVVLTQTDSANNSLTRTKRDIMRAIPWEIPDRSY